jgi:type VI protein secretion system component VasK
MRTILPWVIIGLSVLGGIALFVWNWLTPDEEEVGEDTLMITAAEGEGGADGKKDSLATTTEEYRGASRKSRIIAMKESLERSFEKSFERSLETGDGVKAGARTRMMMPWFMLVGADGSGKKTVLANTGLSVLIRRSTASSSRFPALISSADGRTLSVSQRRRSASARSSRRRAKCSACACRSTSS